MDAVVADTDRRREARLAMWLKATVFPRLGPPHRVVVSNISMLGVGFEAAEPIEPGDSYRITIEAGPMRHRSGLRVISCRRGQGEAYEVGAEFISNVWEPPRRAVERVLRNPSQEIMPQA